MSQAPIAVLEKYASLEPEQDRKLADDDAVQAVFGALEDANSRRILEVTADETLSADEISARTGIPISTTYRKLNTLTDLDLVESSIRLCPAGRHTNEYSRAFDDIAVTFVDGHGIELRIAD